LLSQNQFTEVLATLKAFALQNGTAASATALGHLSSLVPQLARGARSLPQSPANWRSLWIPSLHSLSNIAAVGPQKSSAQAYVYLQRLLLERGTELSLPWEELPFEAWKECLEQVLFPLLQVQPRSASDVPADIGARQANAAQLLCRVVLTHLHDWLESAPSAFPVLFLRLLHILVNEASGTDHAHEQLLQSLKNLLLVISSDPAFGGLPSPQQGESLLEATWNVVAPTFPALQREIGMILNPDAYPEQPDQASPYSQGAAVTGPGTVHISGCPPQAPEGAPV